MGEVAALFWDVGGVLLTNGWDRAARQRATQQFNLDWEDFQDRHELVMALFETGQMTLGDYLGRTIFYRPRAFTKDEFRAFMLAQSQPNAGTLAIVERLARLPHYFMATLNNESDELNHYRIEMFQLRRYFKAFFSSCYLRVRKPDCAIFQSALQISQRKAEDCLFIDDRAINLECARMVGMRVIHFQHPTQLHEELQQQGINVPTP